MQLVKSIIFLPKYEKNAIIKQKEGEKLMEIMKKLRNGGGHLL